MGGLGEIPVELQSETQTRVELFADALGTVPPDLSTGADSHGRNVKEFKKITDVECFPLSDVQPSCRAPSYRPRVAAVPQASRKGARLLLKPFSGYRRFKSLFLPVLVPPQSCSTYDFKAS